MFSSKAVYQSMKCTIQWPVFLKLLETECLDVLSSLLGCDSVSLVACFLRSL